MMKALLILAALTLAGCESEQSSPSTQKSARSQEANDVLLKFGGVGHSGRRDFIDDGKTSASKEKK